MLAPPATAIVGRAFPEGDQFLFSGVHGDAIDVRFVDPDAEPEAAPAAPDGGFERVRAQVERWSQRKAAALADRREPGFWERPDAERAEVLAQVEYLDRLEAAFETAARPVRRSGGRSSPLLAGRAIVRRYSCEPSPLARDASGWRTGGLDAVLGGDFDPVRSG